MVWLPFECFGQSVCLAFDLEDLDGLVGGAGCKAAAVVVKLSIVLEGVSDAGKEECIVCAECGACIQSCHRGRSLLLLVTPVGVSFQASSQIMRLYHIAMWCSLQVSSLKVLGLVLWKSVRWFQCRMNVLSSVLQLQPWGLALVRTWRRWPEGETGREHCLKRGE
jgi:ferredoxin